MRPWERRWFNYWTSCPHRRPQPDPGYWFIAAPIRALAWYLTRK